MSENETTRGLRELANQLRERVARLQKELTDAERKSGSSWAKLILAALSKSKVRRKPTGFPHV